MRAIATALAAVLLGAGGCDRSDEVRTSKRPTGDPVQQRGGQVVATDVLAGVRAFNESASDLGKKLTERGSRQELKRLGQEVVEAAEQRNRLLEQLDERLDSRASQAASSFEGPLDARTLSELAGLEGDAFDERALDLVQRAHQQMAERLRGTEERRLDPISAAVVRDTLESLERRAQSARALQARGGSGPASPKP